jgi:hypothetical protein
MITSYKKYTKIMMFGILFSFARSITVLFANIMTNYNFEKRFSLNNNYSLEEEHYIIYVKDDLR